MSRELEYLQSLVNDYGDIYKSLTPLEKISPDLLSNAQYGELKSLVAQRNELILAMGIEFPRLMARYNFTRQTRTPDDELFKLAKLLKLDNTQEPLYYGDVVKAAREDIQKARGDNEEMKHALGIIANIASEYEDENKYTSDDYIKLLQTRLGRVSVLCARAHRGEFPKDDD